MNDRELILNRLHELKNYYREKNELDLLMKDSLATIRNVCIIQFIEDLISEILENQL